LLPPIRQSVPGPGRAGPGRPTAMLAAGGGRVRPDGIAPGRGPRSSPRLATPSAGRGARRVAFLDPVVMLGLDLGLDPGQAIVGRQLAGDPVVQAGFMTDSTYDPPSRPDRRRGSGGDGGGSTSCALSNARISSPRGPSGSQSVRADFV